MTIRRFATRSCWLAGAIALAFGSLTSAQAQHATPRASVTYTVLHNFAGGPDGSDPSAVTPAGDGGYYGTTYSGGDMDCHSGWGCGVVFKLAPDGTETVLYSFVGGTDGDGPGEVLLDERGNLYGTTTYGGELDCGFGNGCGVVFELAPDGTETVLHAFTEADGEFVNSPLARDKQGNLYGTTYSTTKPCPSGGGKSCGTVFKLASDGTYTTLYTFTDGADGAFPNGNLALDGAGNLYGATETGGIDNNGVIFELTPDGTFVTLYAFMGGADGSAPLGGVVRDADGNLYGTTQYGGLTVCGRFSNCGTVFKLAPSGIHTVLYAFKGDKDGAYPQATLIRNPIDGALYGTTSWGANKTRSGSVFLIRPNGNEQTVHRLNGPESHTALVKGQGGQLIGIDSGGINGNGMIYSLQMTE